MESSVKEYRIMQSQVSEFVSKRRCVVLQFWRQICEAFSSRADREDFRERDDNIEALTPLLHLQ